MKEKCALFLELDIKQIFLILNIKHKNKGGESNNYDGIYRKVAQRVGYLLPN